MYNKIHVAVLEKLQTQLASLPLEVVLAALSEPSDFLKHWKGAIKHLSREQGWSFRLWLCVTGRKLGLPQYSLQMLRNLVQEMQISGIEVHSDDYLQMLQGSYLQPNESQTPLSEQSELAFDVLNTMHERGESIITHDVIVSMIESIARSPSQSEEGRKLQVTLETFLTQVELPCLDESLLIRLMDAYAAQDNRERFWEVWRIPPRFQTARSPQMYAYVFRRVADTQHQSWCIDAVRRCFHEMLGEDPPVRPTREVKEALKACLRVADPTAEVIAQHIVVKDQNSKRAAEQEFVKLFRLLALPFNG